MTRAVSLAAALVLAACASTPTDDRVLEVRIGHVAPLTGGLAHIAKDNENGVRLALDEANARAPRIGSARLRFVLIAEDDSSREEAVAARVAAVAAAERLVEARVVAVVGHLTSTASVPASDVYDRAGIPMVTPSATHPRLTAQGRNNVFRMIADDREEAEALADYIRVALRPRKVIIAEEATRYGRETAEFVEARLKANGVAVLPVMQIGMLNVLGVVEDENPDVIFLSGMDFNLAEAIRKLRRPGVRAVLVAGSGACTDGIVDRTRGAAEGLLCSQAGIPPQAAGRGFAARYRAAYRSDPVLYSPGAYDAASAIVAAILKAQSTDPARIAAELANIRHDGVTGEVAFDRTGNRLRSETTIFQMRSGGIWPVQVVRDGQVLDYSALVRSR